jgi:hypothetical protein
LFKEDGEAVGKAFVEILGSRGKYLSQFKLTPEREFSKKLGWGRTASALEIATNVMESRYPDLVALDKFLEKNQHIDPKCLEFRNACARAGLKPPPIFNVREGIYLGQDWWGYPATDKERLRDKFLVANAISSKKSQCLDFTKDFPLTHMGNDKIFCHSQR